MREGAREKDSKRKEKEGEKEKEGKLGLASERSERG